MQAWLGTPRVEGQGEELTLLELVLVLVVEVHHPSQVNPPRCQSPVSLMPGQIRLAQGSGGYPPFQMGSCPCLKRV